MQAPPFLNPGVVSLAKSSCAACGTGREHFRLLAWLSSGLWASWQALQGHLAFSILPEAHFGSSVIKRSAIDLFQDVRSYLLFPGYRISSWSKAHMALPPPPPVEEVQVSQILKVHRKDLGSPSQQKFIAF